MIIKKKEYSYLFCSEHCTNVVLHAWVPIGRDHWVSLALPHLVGAVDSHTCGDDAVALQHLHHLCILLSQHTANLKRLVQ